jgi:hypothetical protein
MPALQALFAAAGYEFTARYPIPFTLKLLRAGCPLVLRAMAGGGNGLVQGRGEAEGKVQLLFKSTIPNQDHAWLRNRAERFGDQHGRCLFRV